jgi:hypothetical protein
LPDYIEFQDDEETAGARKPLNEYLPQASSSCIEMLRKMFLFDPKERLPVEKALKSEYWTEDPLPVGNEQLLPEGLLGVKEEK